MTYIWELLIYLQKILWACNRKTDENSDSEVKTNGKSIESFEYLILNYKIFFLKRIF